MTKLVILADLGHLRAFSFTPAEPEHHARYRVQEIDLRPQDKPERISERVTDQAGRFAQHGNPGMTNGEAHNLETEQERRIIKTLADRIERILQRSPCDQWTLAAPKTICHRLKDAIGNAARRSLARVEPADLTKLHVKEVEARFMA
ncbi:MAG: host attachment protein [Verrucomicrobiales bacterium]